MIQLIIAERLISLRKKAGLSQSAVADLLAVTRQAVSKWESGKASPSLEAYSALAALYHTSIEAIITGSDAVTDCELTEIPGSFFAERLKNLRTARSLSQGEVSEALSVSRQSVSKWERGEAEPDGERLIALSQLFKAPLSLLLPYTKKEMVIIPDETPIIEDETPIIEDETPIIEDETPTVTVKQDETTKKRYRDMLRRAAAIRKKKKEEKETGDNTPPFRTISDIGPNDPAYVYVDEDDKKLRTMLPLLAAIPLAVATVAIIFRKK